MHLLLVRPQRQIQLIDRKRFGFIAQIAVQQIDRRTQTTNLLDRLGQRPVEHLLAAGDHDDLALQLLIDFVVGHVDAAPTVPNDDAALTNRDAHLVQEFDGVQQATSVGFERLLLAERLLLLHLGLVQQELDVVHALAQPKVRFLLALFGGESRLVDDALTFAAKCKVTERKHRFW